MFKRFMNDMKKYWKYAIYSSKAQLKSEIANSYLNWLCLLYTSDAADETYPV